MYVNIYIVLSICLFIYLFTFRIAMYIYRVCIYTFTYLFIYPFTYRYLYIYTCLCTIHIWDCVVLDHILMILYIYIYASNIMEENEHVINVYIWIQIYTFIYPCNGIQWLFLSKKGSQCCRFPVFKSQGLGGASRHGTVDGSEIRRLHQLRLEVYPMIYQV